MKRTLGFLALAATLSHASLTHAGGWQSMPSPTTLTLFGVANVDAATWVAVGDLGTILRSANGGDSWTSIASPVGDVLRGVSFRGSLGLAVGIGGRVLRTTDGGLNWVVVDRPTTKGLYGVSIGARMAVITGEEGRIFVSLDDGLTWSPRFASTAFVLTSVSVAGDGVVGVGGGGSIAMSSYPGATWAGGNGMVGGVNTQLTSTCFVTPLTGWAVGGDPLVPSMIIRSDLGGVTWTAETSPSAAFLTGVSFAAADTGTAVGAQGAIVHTDDGGAHWSLQTSGVAQGLNAVHFRTTSEGVAVGAGGTIVKTVTRGLTAVGDPRIPGNGLRLAVLRNPVPPAEPVRFSFEVQAASRASLQVLDVSGRRVATVVDEVLPAGAHTLAWERQGVAVPPGLYFAQLRAGSRGDTVPFVLLH